MKLAFTSVLWLWNVMEGKRSWSLTLKAEAGSYDAGLVRTPLPNCGSGTVLKNELPLSPVAALARVREGTLSRACATSPLMM